MCLQKVKWNCHIPQKFHLWAYLQNDRVWFSLAVISTMAKKKGFGEESIHLVFTSWPQSTGEGSQGRSPSRDRQGNHGDTLLPGLLHTVCSACFLAIAPDPFMGVSPTVGWTLPYWSLIPLARTHMRVHTRAHTHRSSFPLEGPLSQVTLVCI